MFESPSLQGAHPLRYLEGLPKVISLSPGAGGKDLYDLVAGSQEKLRADLAQHGALLFRDCDIHTPRDFHRLLEALNINPCPQGDFFGEVIRAETAPNMMQPTLVPDEFVIAPHNESAFWYKQPKYIAFFCEATEAQYGQTPIIDCHRVAKQFSDSLTAKLSQCEVVSQYVFDSENNNQELVGGQNRNCWQKVFHAQDPADVEAALEGRDDVELRWRNNGSLHILITSRPFATHPQTNESCFRALRSCDFENCIFMLKHFARNQMPYHRYLSARTIMGISSWAASANLVEHQRYAWKTSFRGGPELIRSERQEITQAIFDNSTIFTWRAGDALILDNFKTAHGRLNIDAKRIIHVFMSDYVDQRELFSEETSP